MEERLAELVRGLSRDERVALVYFLENVSVGEILAVRELRAKYGLRDAERVLGSLIAKGLLERGEGCYNLAPDLRKAATREEAKSELWRLLKKRGAPG